ncbi:hypothetical protein AaE_006079 [Aphanomyces astaci]|uniref:Membrane magnesium transporter n=1 Tax=Aphanomyces astaci TaxID=112090 RepID=A0A6A5AI95_APHAT|nr:hypothetical protein AaE_006079 [Aphanomyces astaci]
MAGKLLIAAGSLLLVHAGYYTLQCKSMPLSICAAVDVREPHLSSLPSDEEYVKLAEVPDASLPPLAVRATHATQSPAKVELTISFLFFLVGVLLTAGDFAPIRSTQFFNTKSFDWIASNPEFAVFNHRGKYLPKKKDT